MKKEALTIRLIKPLILRLILRRQQKVQFCPGPRKTIPPKVGLTTGIHLVFRRLKFKADKEIGQKGTFFKGLIFSLGLGLILFPLLPPPPAQAEAVQKNDSSFQKLVDRLSVLDDPVFREGAGILIVQAPGERYRLQFRLIARGPEALRLEIFDPFGRPLLYLVSYQGEIRLLSIPQKKEIPFDLPSSGPWSAFPKIDIRELLKIFWGRVPLFPYDTRQSSLSSEKGKESVKFEFRGSVHQEIWITPAPFTLTKSRITSPSREGEIEILFSDFSESAGNRTPMRCEIKDGTGEQAFTLRYETLIPRPDIPDEIFELPEFSDSQPSKKKKP
jgi:hypothetical protein